MPGIPHISPLTSSPVHPSYIHTSHLNFIDNNGRTLLLRGVNLSGASKAPHGQLSHQHHDFWEQAERGDVTFVGRPLRLDDGSADTHLARLRGWGFNLLRFPFTWEAVEHEGPGIYDYEYMDYLVQVLVKCKEYGFKVYMDPHQDCWSRFSGGSGAPFWTLPACSINPSGITATQSAILHSEYPSLHAPHPADLPAMIWSTNYGRLLSQTLFTLFFAGKDFAPECILDGINIQDWLQSHFLGACSALAQRIAQFEGGSLLEECVVGWDSLNEPFEGLVGWLDVSVNPTAQGSTLKKGTHPTPAQSMRLGMGQKQSLENWTFGGMGPRRDGWVEVDPKGWKLWASAEELGEVEVDGEAKNERWGWIRGKQWTKGLGTCIWANHGVWDVESGFVLRGDYFRYRPLKSSNGTDEHVDLIQVEFLQDYYKPFYLSLTSSIRAHHPESIIFIQPPVFAPPPAFSPSELRGRAAYSPHYYDGLTLVSRHWNWFNADALGMLRGRYDHVVGGKARAVKIGEGAIRRSLREQIGYLGDDVGVLGGCGEDHDHEGGEDREDLEAEADERLARSTGTYPGALPGHLSLSLHAAAGAIAPSTTLATSSIAPTKPTTGIYPTLIGEIGTPFDMDSKRSYGRTEGGKYTGDYGRQESALDASLNACDGGVGYLRGVGVGCEDLTLGGKQADKAEEKPKATERPVNYTIWTYVPDDHSWEWGDGWNLEDLSLWSWGDWVDEGEGVGESLREGKGRMDKSLCRSSETRASADETRASADMKANAKTKTNAHPNQPARSRSQRMPRRDSKKVVQEEEGLDSRAGLLGLGDDDDDDASEDEDTSEVEMEDRGPSRSMPAKAKQQGGGLRPTQMRIGMDGSELSLDTLGGGEEREDRKVRMKRSSATVGSTASSSSSSSASATSSTGSSTPPFSPSSSYPKGYTPNPYTFLTNGSRAVRAFARPWPTKVVGQAVDVRFELDKGVFRLGVEVRVGDWVEYRGRGVDGEVGEVEDGEGEGEGGEWDERKATEVYLPLVHYASRELVEDALGMWGRRTLSSRTLNSLSSSTEMEVTGTETDSSTLTVVVDSEVEGGGSDGETKSKQEREEKAKLLIRDVYTPLSSSSSSRSTFSKSEDKDKHSSAKTPTDADIDEPSSIPLIDVEVKISTGRYKIKGQRLLWWYDVPSSTSSEEPLRVELEVRRREGPLKALVDWRKLSASLTESRSGCQDEVGVDAGAEAEAREQVLMKEYVRVFGARPGHAHGARLLAGHGWCERMCGEDGVCVVM